MIIESYGQRVLESRNRIPVILLCITLVGLLLRLYPILMTPETRRYGAGMFGDTHLYHRMAFNLISGHGLSGTYSPKAYGTAGEEPSVFEPASTRGPSYALFLAAVYRLSPAEDRQSLSRWNRVWNRVRIVQALMDVLTGLLLFLTVRRLVSTPTPALLAAGLYALSPYNIFYTKALLVETLVTFLTALALYATIRAWRTRQGRWSLLAGATLAAAALGRPENLVMAPILALALVWASPHRRTGFRLAGLLLLGFLLTLAPWVARNAAVRGGSSPATLSAGGGFNLFLGTYETNSNWVGWGKLPPEEFPDPVERQRLEELLARFDRSIQDGPAVCSSIDSSSASPWNGFENSR